MKRVLLITLTLAMVFLGMKQDLHGQTKVFDQTITWYYPPYNHGGYGFYWWHRTDGNSLINYGNMPSSNWVSPTDYYNGNFSMSVQVISQPSSEPFYIQFGIWGDKHKGSLHTETVAARKYVSGGAGSSGSWGLGSPANWWNKQSGDRVDFTRANDFYRIGVVLWDGASTCIPMGHDWSSSGCPENAYKYFPMTIKISVYASGGSGPPPPPPPPPPTVNPPSYSIDFWGERTNKVVSTEDQYSYQSNFSSVQDGNGQHLKLTPGTNVYFRKKSDHSKTQTLIVPYRPGAPSFGIDYSNERTSATISDEYDHSSNSDMSSSTRGNGSHVSLTPGSNKYFRKRPTGSNFASNKQTLTVPGRPGAPSFGIDYTNERTSETVGSEYIYSSNSDMSSSGSGDGSHVSLIPGFDMYFMKVATGSAFASGKQTLAVPDRPADPSFTIDFTSENTFEEVSSAYIYSNNSNMTSSLSGDGSRVSLTPGSDIFFMREATGSAFASGKQKLLVPERPAAPSFAIDYMKEEISTPIGAEYAYGYQPDLGDAVQGSGNTLELTPGMDVYFQGLASMAAFASEVQTLPSPARPATPIMDIDYAGETTADVVSTDLQYSESSGFETAEQGSGSALDLVPGTKVYFRKAATASDYASDAYELRVPERPVISGVAGESTDLYPFMAEFTFMQEVLSLAAADVSLVNAELKNLNLKSSGNEETVFSGEVFATANDVISISLPANVIQEGNFSSAAYLVSFTGQLPAVGTGGMDISSFTVYPNPGKGVFRLKFENFDRQASYTVQCCSLSGSVVHTEEFYGTENVRMDLSRLSKGLYLLRLSEDGQEKGVLKLIIE